MISIQSGYAIVVDDEAANREFVERLLQTASFKVVSAGSGAEALAATKNIPTLSIALVDHELPDVTGLELIKQFRATYPDTLLVMATMHDDRNLIDQAFLAGVDVFLVKPHGFMELYRRLQEVNNDMSRLRALIIDQYGPRPYRGGSKRKTSDAAPGVATAEVATAPAAQPPATPVAEPVKAEEQPVPKRKTAEAKAVEPVATASTPAPTMPADVPEVPKRKTSEAKAIEPAPAVSMPDVPAKAEEPPVPKRKTAETKAVEPAPIVPSPTESVNTDAPIAPKRRTSEAKVVEPTPAASTTVPVEPVKAEVPQSPKRKTTELKAMDSAPASPSAEAAKTEPTKVEAVSPAPTKPTESAPLAPANPEPAKASASAGDKDQPKKAEGEPEKGKSIWRFLRGGKS